MMRASAAAWLRVLSIAAWLPHAGRRFRAARLRRIKNQNLLSGHFYSPIPNMAEIQRDAERIFDHWPRVLPGIDLNEQVQLDLLRAISTYYGELPFNEHAIPGRRYYFENPMYSYSDAICLYGMIRHIKPRHIIEVGSGFSSAAILDTNELSFGHSIACTFIEPYSDRLLALMTPDDRRRVEILPHRLQDVPLSRFSTLKANDILFVDSSHVLKVGSDVQRLFAEILPALRCGVYIHFHDVFFPFEYPRAWIQDGRYWTEAYALRAFLEFNTTFEIVLFNTYLEHFHRDEFERRMPLCLKNEGGSIWLRRTK
jgi:predicted O-methyltransferase YrrM